jgi:hypothetical protein
MTMHPAPGAAHAAAGRLSIAHAQPRRGFRVTCFESSIYAVDTRIGRHSFVTPGVSDDRPGAS